MRITFNRVNSEIKDLGFELVKGEGYFYFVGLTSDSPMLRLDGIYGSMHLSAYTVDEIRTILIDRIEEAI